MTTGALVAYAAILASTLGLVSKTWDDIGTDFQQQVS